MQLWDFTSVGIFRPPLLMSIKLLWGLLTTLARQTSLFFAHLHHLHFAVVKNVTVGEVARPRYNHLAVNALKTDFI
jgi:hypothetical protein